MYTIGPINHMVPRNSFFAIYLLTVYYCGPYNSSSNCYINGNASSFINPDNPPPYLCGPILSRQFHFIGSRRDQCGPDNPNIYLLPHVNCPANLN